MPLRILFADDSMTAQNMGKKILSEAGYEVIAVSNGAAAVKKIAEQKPDIIILDVYMPGYSGLEVCEKVRGSLETLKTPVLLTVGKMEPYKPEDANRVKADGVIIKPFEASDLLAIVKKFEERIQQAAAKSVPQQTVLMERKYEEEFAAPAPEPLADHHATGKTGLQPMVEVPDHMASSAAFGDLLGGDSAMSIEHFATNTPASAFETSVIVPAPPMPVVESIPVVENETPAPWQEEEQAPSPVTSSPVIETAIPETPAPEIPVVQAPVVERTAPPTEPITPYVETAMPELVVTPVVPEPEAVVFSPDPALEIEPAFAPEPAHPPLIPVFKDVEPDTASYEMMPTAAPPVVDWEIPREPGLQESFEVTTRTTVVDRVEPGLMSTIEHVQGFPSLREEEPAVIPEPAQASEPAATVIATSAPGEPMQQPEIEAIPEVSDADFEARVTAALAAYSHASEGAPMPPAVAEEMPDSDQMAVDVPATDERVSATDESITNAPAMLDVPERAVSVPEIPVSEISAVTAMETVSQVPPPSFEYHPPVGVPEIAAAYPPMVETEPPAQHVESRAEEESDAAHAALAAGLESALPAAAVAAAAETRTDDHHTIAQAVHRVMERLKPELVEEIMRELRSKK